jgi:hypothetical protein
MSFNHVLVSTLSIPQTGDLHNDPTMSDWLWKLDGVPVRKELYDLGVALRRTYSGYRFQATRKDGNTKVRITYADDVEKIAYCDVNVFIEGSDYVVGRIGYGKKFGVREAEKATYMVHSRKITNDKFAEHRDQYYMSFASDPKKALKVALAKLVPYSPKEMADVSLRPFKYAISNTRDDVKTNLDKLISPMQNRDVLMRELKGMLAQGVTFVTDEFRTAALGFTQAEQDWHAVRNKPIHGYYVYVRMVGDEQWADIVNATDAQNYSHTHDCAVQSMPMADVPEDIQGKLAVLSIGDLGQYMQSVGMRVSEKSFWLERE